MPRVRKIPKISRSARSLTSYLLLALVGLVVCTGIALTVRHMRAKASLEAEVTVVDLMHALHSEDADIGRVAAAALANFGITPVQASIAALGNFEAEQTIERIGGQGMEPLLTAMQHFRNCTSVEVAAAEFLGRTGDARAARPLIAALEHGRNRQTRAHIAGALGDLGDVSAVAPLIAVLNDQDRVLEWVSAADALGKIGDARAVEALTAVLSADSTASAKSAARALGRIGNARAVHALVAALANEPRYHLTSIAVQEALADIGGPAVGPLVNALKHGSVDARQNAASALGIIGDTDSIEALIAALNDNDISVRSLVARTLGNTGDAGAVEALIGALSDDAWRVQCEVVAALGNIGDVRAIEPVITALQSEDRAVRLSAAQTLGILGDARAIEPLITALQSEDWVVRASAAQTLGILGDARAVAPLQAVLMDTLAVRLQAALALGTLGDSQSGADALVSSLTSWRAHVAVVSALHKLNWEPQTDEEKVRWWIAVEDASQHVRHSRVISALHKLNREPQTDEEEVQRLRACAAAAWAGFRTWGLKGEEGYEWWEDLRQRWSVRPEITLIDRVLLKDVEAADYATMENAVFALIMLGREELVPKLVAKLENKGTVNMANAYLHSGHAGLKRAALSFAKRHGYIIVEGPGDRSGVRWGGSKP